MAHLRPDNSPAKRAQVDSGRNNPYQAPEADQRAEEYAPLEHGRLIQATRGSRLAASFIDGVLALGVLLPIQVAAGVYRGFPNPNAQQLSPLQTVMWSAVGLLVYVALHGYFLKRGGQTIGKRLMRIRIANAQDGSTPPLDRLLLWRVLPVHVVVLVPFVGLLATLVDVLCIFRPDHRCIHDHLAGTVVVKATE